jgi:hypothetical protein
MSWIFYATLRRVALLTYHKNKSILSSFQIPFFVFPFVQLVSQKLQSKRDPRQSHFLPTSYHTPHFPNEAANCRFCAEDVTVSQRGVLIWDNSVESKHSGQLIRSSSWLNFRYVGLQVVSSCIRFMIKGFKQLTPTEYPYA